MMQLQSCTWREQGFSKKLNLCSDLSYLFLLLFFVDFLSLGSGALTTIYAFISTRELFFAGAILCSLPLLWQKKREIFLHPSVLFIGVFLLFVAVNGLRGLAAGNDMGIIRSDVMGFLSLLLLPTVLAVCSSRQRLELLLRLVILVCGFWALCSLILSYYHFYPEAFAKSLYGFFEDNTICSLTVLGGNGTRVFFHTASRYFLPALLCAVYFVVYRREKNDLYTAIMMLLCAALFITYSRAVCFGAAVSVALLILVYTICQRQLLKRLLFTGGIVLLGTVVILSAIGFSQGFNLFSAMVSRAAIVSEAPSEGDDGTSIEGADQNGNLLRSDDGTSIDGADQNGNLLRDDELASLSERQVKMEELSQLIIAHPIFGGGLGTAVAYGNGYVEYFYHDLWAKTGILGILLFLLPFFWGLSQLRHKPIRENGLYQVFLVGILFFLLISYFNPCLNSVTGLSWYLLFLTVSTSLQRQKPGLLPEIETK